MFFNPTNGNVVVKLLKSFTDLKTRSGIILPNVEQDMNIATIVTIPEERKYRYRVYDNYGTPVRDDEGNVKEATGYIDVNVGDRVMFERRQHAEYDRGPDRFIIKHMVPIESKYVHDADENHDYFILRFEDILGTVTGSSFRQTDPIGELYPIAPPKAIQKTSSGYK